MKCPHCLVEVHSSFNTCNINSYVGQVGNFQKNVVYWQIHAMQCPACGDAILKLQPWNSTKSFGEWFVYPRTSARAPVPPEVPSDLASDYSEAAQVLQLSPKASAALSRRCLQGTLRSQGYTQRDLAPAIDAVLKGNTLPPALASNLDAIRNIGNFAAHPMKDTATGQILPVEPEEAEWNLDVLDELFDFYFVQPERAKAMRAALDAKLASAGKPPMK